MSINESDFFDWHENLETPVDNKAIDKKLSELSTMNRFSGLKSDVEHGEEEIEQTEVQKIYDDFFQKVDQRDNFKYSQFLRRLTSFINDDGSINQRKLEIQLSKMDINSDNKEVTQFMKFIREDSQDTNNIYLAFVDIYNKFRDFQSLSLNILKPTNKQISKYVQKSLEKYFEKNNFSKYKISIHLQNIDDYQDPFRNILSLFNEIPEDINELINMIDEKNKDLVVVKRIGLHNGEEKKLHYISFEKGSDTFKDELDLLPKVLGENFSSLLFQMVEQLFNEISIEEFHQVLLAFKGAIEDIPEEEKEKQGFELFVAIGERFSEIFNSKELNPILEKVNKILTAFEGDLEEVFNENILVENNSIFPTLIHSDRKILEETGFDLTSSQENFEINTDRNIYKIDTNGNPIKVGEEGIEIESFDDPEFVELKSTDPAEKFVGIKFGKEMIVVSTPLHPRHISIDMDNKTEKGITSYGNIDIQWA